LKISYL